MTDLPTDTDDSDGTPVENPFGSTFIGPGPGDAIDLEPLPEVAPGRGRRASDSVIGTSTGDE